MFPEIFLTLLILCTMGGIICITINLTKRNAYVPKTKIIYRYIPKTFEDEQANQPFVSDIFKSMFTEQTPWLMSVTNYDSNKQEAVNKYYISQI